MFEPTYGYLAWLLSVIALTLCGLGAQRLLRVPFSPPLRWLLAPAVGQAVIACLIGGGVAIAVAPLRTLAPAIWIAFGLLAALGWWDFVRPHRAPPADAAAGSAAAAGAWRAGLWLALAALLPFGILWPYLRDGLANHRGSGLWDGWSYVAVGQYYWDYARYTYTPGPLFYAYGAAFDDARFVASATLAWLGSVLRPGDAQSAMGLFQASALFAAIAASAAFAWTRRMPAPATALFLAVCGLSGWFANAVWANNCDHLLALAYMPAFFAVIDAPARLAAKRGLLALLTAGLAYTYPELVWFPIGWSLIWLVQRAREEGESLRDVWATLWRVGVIAGVVALPYLPSMAAFLHWQASSAMRTAEARPGLGMLAGLVDPAWAWSAIWALGGEHRYTLVWRAEAVVAAVLCLLLGVGLVRLLRTRQYALVVTLLGTIALAALFAIGRHYGYAAYKILLSGWWLVAWTLVCSAAHARRVWLVVAVAALVALPVTTVARGLSILERPTALELGPLRRMASVRRVREIVPLVGGRPLGLFITDVESTYWAYYYLRDQKLHLSELRGYLRNRRMRARIERAGGWPAWGDLRYILTDAPVQLPFRESADWTPVWSGEGYHLWQVGARPWLAVVQTTTPNGIETYKGAPFFWMGGGATRIQLVTSEAGTLALSADFLPGPSAEPAGGRRRLWIRDGRGRARVETVAAGPQTIAIDVAAGRNIVKIAVLDAVVRPVQPNGDPRPLLLGVGAPRLTFVPGGQP